MNDAIPWLDLILRWTHVFAGILWVGTTYYFTWLDGWFSEPEKQSRDDKSMEKHTVWMINGVGLYSVAKPNNPTSLPATLHRFRWASGITWFTGLLLFGLLFYHGSSLISLEDAVIGKGGAIGLSCGLLLAGWAGYDLLWKQCPSKVVSLIVSYVLVVVTAWVSCKYFSGRAAYLQLGAMLGTIMTANVWMRILPVQRRLVAALRAGQPADTAELTRARERARHNTFLAIPVVFTMISNHYSGLYGSNYNWIILAGLVLAGGVAAPLVRRA